MGGTRPRVVVGVPMTDAVYQMLRDREPRVEIVREPGLLPPQRWPADFEGDPAFRRDTAAERAFAALLDSADVLYGIPDTSPTTLARVVRSNPRLRWVQAMAAGAGAQLKAASLTREELDRVVVTTSAGVHARPLAEFALFGLLAGAKDLPRLQELQAARTWSGRWPMGQLGDQTVLVVGLGGIGREVARLLTALGARVIGVRRNPVATDGVDEVVSPDKLAAAAAEADAMVVALPGTTATEGLVNAQVLAALPRGATVVSVGRGAVIDEPALVDALRSGQVGLAVLDVVAVEPLAADSPLWGLPNVVISPHTAANSRAEERRIAELFLENVDAFLAGRALRNHVDTVEFY